MDGTDLFLVSGAAGTIGSLLIPPLSYVSPGNVTAVGLGGTNEITNYGGELPATLRSIGLYGGSLYVTSSTSGTPATLSLLPANPLYGLAQIAAPDPINGLPGQTNTLPGFPTAAGPSSWGFWFADANTVYVADDRTAATGGGIQKWTLSGGIWTLAATYTLPPVIGSTRIGARMVTGRKDADGNNVLFAISSTTNGQAFTFTDTGAIPPVTTVIATGTASNVLRGIAVLPTVQTISGTIALDSVDFTMLSPFPTIPLTVQFRTADNNNFTRTAKLNADGSFSISGVPANLYAAALRTPINLQKDVSGVDATAGDANIGTVTLPGGDSSGDNTINFDDFLILLNAFGSNAADPMSGYDATADFNYDGIVNFDDFLILLNNFGAVGDL